MSNEDNNYFANMRDQLVTDHVGSKALVELLIEKGIITKKEYKEKFDSIYESQSEKVYNFLETGIVEEEKK